MSAPLLLVSVRDRAEAELAVLGGADWIDLKEPCAGPLGAVGQATAWRVAEAIPATIPLSAACGELCDWPRAAARRLLWIPRVSYLKLGLAGCAELADWRTLWLRARDETNRAGKGLAAVAYADADFAAAPAWEEVVRMAIDESAPFVLFDTFVKRPSEAQGERKSQSKKGRSRRLRRAEPRSLLDVIAPESLADALRSARKAGVRTVIAGSLNAKSLAELPLKWVDVAAVRGAACAGDRCGQINAQRVADLGEALRSAAGVPRKESLSRLFP